MRRSARGHGRVFPCSEGTTQERNYSLYEENYSAYGAEKVWWALNRKGIVVGRCRAERLMRVLGLVGAVRAPNGRLQQQRKPHRAAHILRASQRLI